MDTHRLDSKTQSLNQLNVEKANNYKDLNERFVKLMKNDFNEATSDTNNYSLNSTQVRFGVKVPPIKQSTSSMLPGVFNTKRYNSNVS